ncbi:MAG: phenylalanine--tRNA ligase subunit beta [Armatimonadetes bacterium]|nr:phenylalanine--tRNA ligase subunit beta [Armatimonadota bacterium]
MKLTESMLRDMVETRLTAEEIGDLLTMTGFELEDIEVVEGEKVLDVNIMANRGDGASVLGLAREVLAKDPSAKPTSLFKGLADWTPPADADAKDVNGLASVVIETSDCTRFSCRVFSNVSNGESPAWLKERLTKIGQRPISLLVDLTNYVMMETGQPMHAYDLAKVPAGKIIVRGARAGEKVKTLDGIERDLLPGEMMICDQSRPIGVAGVMGGEETEVSATTSACLLESAHFDHRSVRKTRKRLGLQTEASYRFERYVDPEGTVRAIERFGQLLAEAIGATAVPGVVDVYPAPPVRPRLRLRPSRASALLGMPVTADEIERYLTALGCTVERQGDEFAVTAPTWRIDLEREDDFVEEVGRIHGYEKIPEALPIGTTPMGGTHGPLEVIDRVREALVRCGLTQCISHSLRDLHALDAPGGRTIVRNPHSPEMAHLRNSNLPCLAEAAQRNGGRDLQLFEIGRVFSPGVEKPQLSILLTGALDQPSWRLKDRPNADFFTLKGILDRVFAAVGVDATWSLPKETDLRFHPTRSAELSGVGIAGQIHPDVAEACDLPSDTVIAEIDLDGLTRLAPSVTHFHSVHRNPAARRDIAMVVSKDVAYEQINAAVRKAAGEVLEKHWLFDVYEGRGMEEGHHSLAIALQFRKAGNFTDEEANQVRDSVVAALEGLGAKLR